MAINANNKIVDTVLSRIDDYTLISKRDINHPLEIENRQYPKIKVTNLT